MKEKEYITSLNNTAVKEFIKLLDNKKYRNEKKLISLEGKRLIDDCVKSNTSIKSIFICDNKLDKFNNFINSLNNIDIEKLYVISDNIDKKMSNTKTSQGIYAVVDSSDIFSSEDVFNKIEKKENFLILSKISDPNNMGTIIRSAVSFGFYNIILDNCCVDILNSKVIRGSMGTVFKVNLFVSDNLSLIIKKMNEINYSTLATCLTSDSEDLTRIKINSPVSIIMGNEANGLDEELIEISSQKVIIPMKGEVESLNVSVATSILMWEMFKQIGS